MVLVGKIYQLKSQDHTRGSSASNVMMMMMTLYQCMWQTMDEAKDSVTSLHVSDHEILSGSADSQLRRYDIRNGLLHTDFIGCMSACLRMSVKHLAYFVKDTPY